MEFLQNLPPMVWIWGAVIIVIMILALVVGTVQKKKATRHAANYMEQHPDAVRVFLGTKGVMTSETIVVHSVDKLEPNMFNEKGKQGFFLIPGLHVVCLSYSYSRPGVTARTVTKYTDEIEERIEVYPNRAYSLGFDRKQKTFTFEDITGQ